MAETYRMKIAGLERELPLCPVNDKLDIAAFIIFGDVEMTVAACAELLAKCPAFDPTVQEEERPLPPVYISKFSIYNKEVTVHTPDSPLKQCIVHTDEIVLPYDQANISFDVALLSYSTAESNQYYYRMEPLDRDWVDRKSVV